MCTSIHARMIFHRFYLADHKFQISSLRSGRNTYASMNTKYAFVHEIGPLHIFQLELINQVITNHRISGRFWFTLSLKWRCKRHTNTVSSAHLLAYTIGNQREIGGTKGKVSFRFFVLFCSLTFSGVCMWSLDMHAIGSPTTAWNMPKFYSFLFCHYVSLTSATVW